MPEHIVIEKAYFNQVLMILLSTHRHILIDVCNSQSSNNFLTLVMLDNMLKHSTGRGLKRFMASEREGVSPFKWPRLNLATDQGPNMVLEDFYLACLPELSYLPNRDMVSTILHCYMSSIRFRFCCISFASTGKGSVVNHNFKLWQWWIFSDDLRSYRYCNCRE